MPSSRGFLRDNAFLAGAVSLPLVVVAFFLLSTAIPRWTVPPPRYDVLLHTRSWDQTGPRVTVEFTVQNGTLQATVRPLPPNVTAHRSALWLFDHQTLSAREVSFPLPERLADDEAARTIPLDTFGGRRVVAEAKAPDGYEIQTRSASSPGLIGDLFGMRRYDRTVTLSNGGRVVRIEIPAVNSYDYPDFLGWLIDE